MKSPPRIASRLIFGHGGLVLVCLALALALVINQSWREHDRRAFADGALPRFSEMLAISRLGDVLAETAAVLAAVSDPAERREALDRIEQARVRLSERIEALNGGRLEASTRDRLRAAVADMMEALTTLDALVGRRIVLLAAVSDLNAHLGALGDLLPDLERGLLSGRAPDQIGAFRALEAVPFPPGPSGTVAANAIRRWARQSQVAVGMMLAANGASEIADLEYLAIRTEESLRRAAAASREADRAAMPVMEAVQSELSALAEGTDGENTVFQIRRQRLTLNENTPAVLDRGRLASDRLMAAVTQIIADVEQDQAVRATALRRQTVLWWTTAGVLAGLGVVLAAWSYLFLRGAVLARARRIGRALDDLRAGRVLAIPEEDARPDELGVMVRSMYGLDVDRRRLIDAHREQADRLSGVISALPEALLVLGADATVEDANPAAARLFGRSPEDLLGRPVTDLVPVEARSALVRTMDHARARPDGESASAAPVAWPGVDDAPGRTVMFTAARIGDVPEGGGGRLLVITRVWEALDKRRDTDAQAALGALVAPVTHDLGTPLGIGVTGASHLGVRARAMRQTQERGDLAPEVIGGFITQVEDAATLIESSLRRAADLVDSLRRVSVDQLSERTRTYSIRTTLSDVATTLAPRLRGTGVRVVVDCPRDEVMTGRPGALFRVLLNLVENARRHAFPEGRPGSVVLAAHSVEAPNQEARVRLQVIDDGIGMSPVVRARLFDAFYTTRADSGGSGLGMGIVHDLVTGPLGGTVEVDSTEGAGTTVTLLLPVALRDEDPARPGETGADDRTTSGTTSTTSTEEVSHAS